MSYPGYGSSIFKFKAICQLSVNWLLMINLVIYLFLFYPKFSSKGKLNVNCISNSKIVALITFLFKFGVEFITSDFLSLLSCLPEHKHSSLTYTILHP